jgi:hypothetical protein
MLPGAIAATCQATTLFQISGGCINRQGFAGRKMRAGVSGVPVLPFEHDVIFLISAF